MHHIDLSRASRETAFSSRDSSGHRHHHRILAPTHGLNRDLAGMASPATSNDIEGLLNDNDTDYGSDFSPEEAILVEQLLSGKLVEDDNPIVNEIEHHEAPQNLRLPRVFGKEERSPLFQAARAAEQVAEQISNSIKRGEHYPDLSEKVKDAPDLGTEVPVEAPPVDPNAPDTRSPLERFRTQPKKALSVTDLVSPAWCELQYWYTLTFHGRKRRTPAMRQGSKVHQVLEDQVHTTVHVRLETKEDAWGLRIWNVIQGLRTLRDDGLTRELEIWGTVDGLVVNGVIDELSYICPDTVMEESLQSPPTKAELPLDQATISDFFKAAGGTSLEDAARSKRRTRTKKVYLCDVKTRGVRNLPSGAAFRPTKIQLMLYHRLLAALATNNVDFSILTARYGLDPLKTFSDSFLAQIGGLHESSGQPFLDAKEEQDSSQESEPSWSQDSLATLLAHNNLSAIWSLMISEFQITLPDGADSLGKVLKAEYRSREDGEILGSKTFATDDLELSTYINHEMEWWKGERQAEGVAVEEAFKCRSCEFADNCEWRIKKVEEAKEKARMTKKRTAAI